MGWIFSSVCCICLILGEMSIGGQLPTTLSVTVWEAGGQILSGGGSLAPALIMIQYTSTKPLITSLQTQTNGQTEPLPLSMQEDE